MPVVAWVAFALVFLGAWALVQARTGAVRGEVGRVKARNQALQAQVAALQAFGQMQARVAEQERLLAEAMGSEVLWSVILRNVSLVIPADVWLTSLSGQLQAEGGGQQPGAARRVGSVQFSGYAFDHLGVAGWLIRLGEVKEFTNAYFSLSQKTELSGRTVVRFSSSVDLSQEAYSRRYQRPQGGR